MRIGTAQVKLLESFARRLFGPFSFETFGTDSTTLVMFLGIPVHFELSVCLSVIEIFKFKL